MKKKIGQFIDSKLKNLQDKLQEKKFFISHLEIRSIRHFFQRIFFGFSDKETWSLFNPIGEFVLPRLKRFKELTNNYPGDFANLEEWEVVLDKIIFAFTYSTYEGKYYEETKEVALLKADLEKVCLDKEKWDDLCIEGYELFGKYFMDLWW